MDRITVDEAMYMDNEYMPYEVLNNYDSDFGTLEEWHRMTVEENLEGAYDDVVSDYKSMLLEDYESPDEIADEVIRGIFCKLCV